jgi:hypothetical protein
MITVQDVRAVAFVLTVDRAIVPAWPADMSVTPDGRDIGA